MLPFAMQRSLILFFSFLSLCVLFSFYNQQVFADAQPQAQPGQPQVIGQVIWVKGSVRAAQPNQTSRMLERRAPLYEHDVIVTDQSGSGQIALTDGSVLVLRTDTQVKIDEYHYKKDEPPSKAKSILSVVTGGFRTITGVIPKENPDGYQVNTPVATIGVRGTDYAVFIDPVEGLLLDLNQGAISVRNTAGTIELNKNLGVAFAAVRAATSSPVVLANKPPVFNAQPEAKPVAPNVINSIDTGGKVPVSGGSGGKTVSSFCVG